MECSVSEVLYRKVYEFMIIIKKNKKRKKENKLNFFTFVWDNHSPQPTKRQPSCGAVALKNLQNFTVSKRLLAHTHTHTCRPFYRRIWGKSFKRF